MKLNLALINLSVEGYMATTVIVATNK